MNTIKWVISRTYEEKETLGHAIVFDGANILFQHKTIELPMFTADLKTNVPMTNCIPEGVYKVTKIYSPTKGNCFMVHDVPGRTAILAHIGNFSTGVKVDTQGCILVGKEFTDINKDGFLDVAGSTETLKKLLEIMPNEFKLIIY